MKLKEAFLFSLIILEETDKAKVKKTILQHNNIYQILSI
jgi:hypothetical protein